MHVFIIYKEMKYRKILIKFNVQIFEKVAFHSCEICISQPRKYKMWVFIFIDPNKILVIKLSGFAKIFTFSTPATVVSVLDDIAHYAQA